MLARVLQAACSLQRDMTNWLNLKGPSRSQKEKSLNAHRSFGVQGCHWGTLDEVVTAQALQPMGALQAQVLV